MATVWTLQEMNPRELVAHPANLEIYGKITIDPDMLESVKENGVMEPIRITGDRQILAGHRRQAHAVEAGIKSVPVLVCRKDLSESDKILELIEANRQREKTVEQKAREFERLAATKEELAKERQRSGKTVDLTANLPQGQKAKPKKESGNAKTQAAKQLGMSRHTAEKAVEVTHKIDELEASGKVEQAEELRETLNRSVSGAHNMIREAGEDEVEPEHDDSIKDHFKQSVSRHVRDAFSRVSEFGELKRRSAAILGDITKLFNTPSGSAIPLDVIKRLFGDIKSALNFAVPYCECPKCRRDVKDSCKTCMGLGWITEQVYSRCRTKEDEQWLNSKRS